jgi:uncharacterized protein YeaO (DUF488 family)
VRKAEIASRDFYDTWLPELAPTAELVSFAQATGTDKEWATFTRRYRQEMSTPAARHLLDVLAALSRTSSFSVGCYCEDEAKCHRSVLRELLAERGAELA